MRASLKRRGRDAAAAVDVVQHLVFGLGGEAYALPLLCVREVVDAALVSSPPADAPAALRGVISAGGEPLAVIDLAVALGNGATAATPQACALIVTVAECGRQMSVGLWIDAVERVLGLAPQDILPPPRLARARGLELIGGLARTGPGLVPILDVEGLLVSDEVCAALRASRRAAPAPEPPGAAR